MNRRLPRGVAGRAVRALALATACLTLLSACVVGYTGYPGKTALRADAGPGAPDLTYRVNKFPVLHGSGDKAIDKVLAESPAFSGPVRIYEGNPEPDKGLFLEVHVQWVPPTATAMVFGYLSVATLTILPAYSGHDGYVVSYRLFRDGELAKVYQYPVTRKVALWLPLLVLVWVNAMTPGESKVFTRTTHRFLADAAADGLL